MPDPFSGTTGTTKQEKTILREAEERAFIGGKDKSGDKKKKKEEKELPSYATLYKKGVDLLKLQGYILELDEMGDHINHRILRAGPPPLVEGITYPHAFNPLQDISADSDLGELDRAFQGAEDAVRSFWEPLYRPVPGESPLLLFTRRLLKMRRMKETQNIHQVLDYGHTFDPEGNLGGHKALQPRIWVPDKEWFSPKLYDVKFSDVFTIFPKAEQQMLMLILGRIGVGRANHLPPGWSEPVDHTARMAGVIVGKDAGLGKSTLFNGLTAALQRCGFVTHTFKSTEDRFGLKAAALSDIAYKDDTSLASLRKFLAAEETKILITNGLFQTEEKFQSAEQIWPKTVILVNSNDWNSKFAYDLDPGIIDRIKIISTYREYEVSKLREQLGGTVSEGSPDLRPRAHIPYLANKLGVSQEALYLWCLRLATDRFYQVISDKEDPTINRLQVEVRYWTTRQRIRFKADVTQALVNGMAFSWMVRTGHSDLPELTPQILHECLEHFYFLGVDPSGLDLMTRMKEHWEKAGRPCTHFYQGFREIRWESVDKSNYYYANIAQKSDQTPATETIKDVMERLVMRDGFQIGGSANYVIENWQNMRHASEELLLEGEKMLEGLDRRDLKRLLNPMQSCEDNWIKNKKYSPDRAEVFRAKAREQLYSRTIRGVK